MALRKTILAIGEVYHIFNRATEKKVIFSTRRECQRFIELMQFYRTRRKVKLSSLDKKERQALIEHNDGIPIVEIICYCIMSNHFHLLLKQNTEGGITQFMRKISDGYSKYFNILHNRVGPLFQGNFKAVRVEDNPQLLQVSRYIHLNPLTGFVVKDLEDYPWSSYHEFVEGVEGFCQRDIVLEQFRSPKSYQRFVLDHANYTKQLKKIEYLLLDG